MLLSAFRADQSEKLSRKYIIQWRRNFALKRFDSISSSIPFLLLFWLIWKRKEKKEMERKERESTLIAIFSRASTNLTIRAILLTCIHLFCGIRSRKNWYEFQRDRHVRNNINDDTNSRLRANFEDLAPPCKRFEIDARTINTGYKRGSKLRLHFFLSFFSKLLLFLFFHHIIPFRC